MEIASGMKTGLPGCCAILSLTRMRLVGFLLLLSGWGLVVAALGMLSAAVPRGIFALAGMGVELLGMVMTVRSHIPRRAARRAREMNEEDEADIGGSMR